MAGPQSLVDLIESPPEPSPTWIEPAILPKGGVLLFGGESKIGKSFLCLEMVRALATGTPLFGSEFFSVPERARVLLVEQELGSQMLRPRVVDIFAEEAREGRLPELREWLFYESKNPQASLSTSEGRAFLRELIAKARPNVLFLDPIGKLHAYAENEAGPINTLFMHLAALRDEFKALGLSVVMTHHFGKLSPDPRSARDELDPLNFRGSSRWVSDPDSIITVKRLRTQTREKDGRKWKWWEVKMKFMLRAGPEPGEIFCNINREGDQRVRFARWAEEEEKGGGGKKEGAKPLGAMPKLSLVK